MEQRTDQQQVEHPAWCIRGTLCRIEGIHHSRPLTATPDDAMDALRVWIERAHTAERISVVVESTVEGDVAYSYLSTGQARILRHQLTRLLDMAKDGAR